MLQHWDLEEWPVELCFQERSKNQYYKRKRGQEHVKAISGKCFTVDIVWRINLCQRWDKKCKDRIQSSLCFQFALIRCTSYKYIGTNILDATQQKKSSFKKSLSRHQSYRLRDCLWTDLNPTGQIRLYITWVNRRLIGQNRVRTELLPALRKWFFLLPASNFAVLCNSLL